MNYSILCLDVDGTLTDGKVYIGNDGEVMKAFNIKDGYGIRQYIEAGGIVAIITGRISKIVGHRAFELGIKEIYQDITNKAQVMELLAKKYHTTIANVAFVGDDMNDLEAIQASGISFMPSDGYEGLKPYVSAVLTHKGGEGAVREAIDILLSEGT
ncbi:MAG: HAD hydrolase family protein [bacterium]|nr:HAD hydrolase family protein [bacterium]